MKQKTRSLAGLLLAIVLFLSLPAMLAAHTPGSHASVGSQIVTALFALAVLGGTTVFYSYPAVPGGTPAATLNTTTGPSAAQATQFASLSCKFQMTDTETSCTFTHNWALTGTETNMFYPVPIINGLANLGTAGATFFSITYAPNTIVLTKGNQTGSGGTYTVVMFKPHTGIR